MSKATGCCSRSGRLVWHRIRRTGSTRGVIRDLGTEAKRRCNDGLVVANIRWDNLDM